MDTWRLIVSQGTRRQRQAKGPQKRQISMGELRNILVNMPSQQRDALLKMFPPPKEAQKFPEKITRCQLLALWTALEALMDTPSHAVEFAYAIVQNRDKMGSEIEKLEKVKEPPEEYKAFDAEREALCKELCNKDAQGAPVHDGQRYVIPPEKREEFDTRSEEVKEKHANAIEDYKAQAARYDDLLDGDIPCPQFVRIPMRALPPGLTARQLEPLQIILE